MVSGIDLCFLVCLKVRFWSRSHDFNVKNTLDAQCTFFCAYSDEMMAFILQVQVHHEIDQNDITLVLNIQRCQIGFLLLYY